MFIRPKLFFTVLGLCLAPLLMLGVFNYFNGLRAAESLLVRDLEGELDNFIGVTSDRLYDQENELLAFGHSQALHGYVEAAGTGSDSPRDELLTAKLQIGFASLLSERSHLVAVSFFDQRKQPVFVAARKANKQASEGLEFRTQDFLPEQAQPDERVWSATTSAVLRSPVSITPSGSILRLTVPVFPEAGDAGALVGALVGELDVASLLSEAAKLRGLAEYTNENSSSRTVVALDNSGRILYHPNQAVVHQPVNDSVPHFKPVATRMISGDSGWQSFTSSTGEEVWASFDAVPDLNVSVAVRGSYPQGMAGARRSGGWGLLEAVLIAFATAVLLTFYLQRRTRGMKRVTEGVAAIAEGKLDHRIELRSSDENRLLADNVNLMSARLQEQIARETEAQQFQSFVKLSAMLTHDLKNAIEALSLIVGNMERHFDNEDFRADAMKSLNLATQNLRALVARLTNPVNTLSGEHKRPQPVDLIPMLKRAGAAIAQPLRGSHQIETHLPTSLVALVDEERIEKVIENLVLNALEAMAGNSGTLTLEAGKTDEGKVFFRVTDTGVGMSRDFIERRLYHPFATTKKKGVGLGLYTCREVVRANGGTISVDSKEGAGTTFRVVLPSPALDRPA